MAPAHLQVVSADPSAHITAMPAIQASIFLLLLDFQCMCLSRSPRAPIDRILQLLYWLGSSVVAPASLPSPSRHCRLMTFAAATNILCHFVRSQVQRGPCMLTVLCGCLAACNEMGFVALHARWLPVSSCLICLLIYHICKSCTKLKCCLH